MSSIKWKNDRLFQHVGNHDEELGYVDLDENTETYVLWLKDTCGVLGLNGGYIRGDEFPTKIAAKDKAASSASACILHYIWMRDVAIEETKRAIDDQWDEISTKLSNGTSKDDLRDEIIRHIKELPIQKIKDWLIKIGEGAIKSVIIEYLKKLLIQ